MSGPLTAELSSRTIIAPGIADLVFRMRTPEKLAFAAGQFVSIAVPEQDGVTVSIPRRSYSIASHSDRGEALRFIIRVIPDGAASAYLMSLPLGATVAMTGPHGFFVLDPHHAGDVVFGATGTGVAAVMPMMGELGRRTEPGRRLLYWGLRHETDLFAHDEIQALAKAAGVDLRIYLTAPSPAWPGLHGRITAAILHDLPALNAPTFYLVGNGAMIVELKRDLMARGINRKKQIRTEAFFD
ncbi:MAG TPA: FAD-binding oxidoreductase [Polyangia bacterium]|nr:FAD-binding oxidoreductase [Polyangia bacterium]